MDFTYIDTHAHIYAEEFEKDTTDVLEKARTSGLKKLFMPNVDLQSIDRMLEMEHKYPDLCVPMMGLHPCYVKKDFENQFPRLYSVRILLVELSENNPIYVHADKVRLYEVIANLLDNAIKFTRKGTISISTDIRSNINNNIDEVIIRIRDTGVGIHSEILPRLFTKFATKSDRGTGLGLFISKGIVEAHGGRIWAENNSDGKGATFSFTLPLSK